MLLFRVSSGKNVAEGVSILYPLIPRPRSTFTAIELSRLLKIAPVFATIEGGLSLMALVWLLSPNAPISIAPFISAGFLCVVAARILFRKGIEVPNDRIQIIGLVPKIVWVEHILFCCAGGLGGFLNAKVANLPIIGLNIYSSIGGLFFFGATLPFINVLAVHLKNR